MNRNYSFALLATLVLVTACSSSEAPEPSSGGESGAAGAAGETGNPARPSPQALNGTFTLAFKPAIEATMTAAFSLVSGTIYDGPVPETFPLVVAAEGSGCQLLKPKLPFCSEGCGGDAVCVEEETCAPYPEAQDVGVVQLSGLGSAPVTMDPFPPSFAYQSQALPHPPCAEGDDVELTTAAFGAVAPCIAPLVVTSTEFPVKRDQALPLSWEAAKDPDVSQIHIKLDVSHHGGKKGEIDCDVRDTGAFEIPAELITSLVDLGLAGYPTIVLTRVVAAPSEAAPRVTFQVSSGIEREVDTGVISCTDDGNCPTQQRCNTDKLTCE